MEPYIFFVFFSAIIMPDGEIKTLTQHVSKCPSEQTVMQMHVPRVDKGEILDWAAACHPISVFLEVPKEELNT